MTGADNISVVLYRYLRTLSVKVSRDTVHRLLSTPLGGGMRYVDTRYRRSGIVDRYVLLYADAGFLDQYADFVCLGARYRYRGG